MWATPPPRTMKPRPITSAMPSQKVRPAITVRLATLPADRPLVE